MAQWQRPNVHGSMPTCSANADNHFGAVWYWQWGIEALALGIETLALAMGVWHGGFGTGVLSGSPLLLLPETAPGQVGGQQR